jgi:hypothetical protein
LIRSGEKKTASPSTTSSWADKRMRVLGLSFLLILTVGCRSSTDNPKPSSSPQQVASRCGGVPPGFEGVFEGTDNKFLAATSRQAIRVKPGVEIKPVVGPDKKVHTLTLSRENENQEISCTCPAGCSAPGRIGCSVVIMPPGGPDATCGGDCETESRTGCCFGCGFVSRVP